jgi:hypothetical protein
MVIYSIFRVQSWKGELFLTVDYNDGGISTDVVNGLVQEWVKTMNLIL